MTTRAPLVPVVLPDAYDGPTGWESFVGRDDVLIKTLYRSDECTAGLMRLRRGAVEAPHVHEHGQHHVWVVRGAVRTEDTVLGPGSYLHVPAGLVHTMVDEGFGCVLFFVFVAER